MKRSLHIGINDYPGTGSDLDGCVNDAMTWMETLKPLDFYSQDLLIDEQAFKKAMTDAIADIVVATHPGDLGIITYSGHGSWVPDADNDEIDGRDEALCPHDCDTNGVLTDDYLYQLFCDCKKDGARIVFISDSCHSGSVARRAPRDGDVTRLTSTYQSKVKFLPPSVHLTPAGMEIAGNREKLPALGRSRDAGVLLISGCKDTEYSYDAWFDGKPAGAFTYVSLWALKQLPADATYWDWFDKIRQQLPNDFYPQTPQLTATVEQRKWRIFSDG